MHGSIDIALASEVLGERLQLSQCFCCRLWSLKDSNPYALIGHHQKGHAGLSQPEDHDMEHAAVRIFRVFWEALCNLHGTQPAGSHFFLICQPSLHLFIKSFDFISIDKRMALAAGFLGKRMQTSPVGRIAEPFPDGRCPEMLHCWLPPAMRQQVSPELHIH